MLILRCDLLVICQYWSHGFDISPHSPLYHLFVKHGSGSLLGRCSFECRILSVFYRKVQIFNESGFLL